MQLKISMSIDRIKSLEQMRETNQKIKAIKLIREYGKVINVSASDENHKIGLREAKQAMDVYFGQTLESDAEAVLVPAWRVHSINVSGPAGEKIDLDLDTLQMHFLSSLPSVGLVEVSRLLDLVDRINEWQCMAPVTQKTDEECT